MLAGVSSPDRFRPVPPHRRPEGRVPGGGQSRVVHRHRGEGAARPPVPPGPRVDGDGVPGVRPRLTSWGTGVVIPHGIRDLARHRGHLNVGLSHDTSQFACDSLRWYWNRIGRQCYPNATSVLPLCGGNAANQYLVQGRPTGVGEQPGRRVPAGALSQLLEAHSDRAAVLPARRVGVPGVLFDTLETAVRLMRNAATRTGLRTTVNVLRRVSETGGRCRTSSGRTCRPGSTTSCPSGTAAPYPKDSGTCRFAIPKPNAATAGKDSDYHASLSNPEGLRRRVTRFDPKPSPTRNSSCSI